MLEFFRVFGEWSEIGLGGVVGVVFGEEFVGIFGEVEELDFVEIAFRGGIGDEFPVAFADAADPRFSSA